MSCAIQLLPHQVEHTNKIINKFQTLHGVLDASTMGCGKTYTTTYIACHYNLPMLVICPAGDIERNWKSMSQYGAYIVGVYSYESIRGAKNRKTNFPYLIRQDIVDEDGSTSTIYHPTNAYIELVQRGMLLVLDETMKIKNGNASTTEACRALIYGIVACSSYSRYILLSATPFDKDAFMIDFIRTLGYTREKQLTSFNPGTGLYNPKGLEEIVAVCKYLDVSKTEEILKNNPKIGETTSKAKAMKIAKALFLDVIKQHVIYAMPAPQIEKDLGTMYYNMSLLEFNRYKIAVTNLAELLLFNDETGDVDMKEGIIQKLTLIIRDIEHCKLSVMAREAIKILREKPLSKVIINVMYSSSIPMLLERMHFYGCPCVPAVLSGETKKNDRSYIIAKFQEPNLTSRLIIATIGTGSVGISLHDLHGGYERILS